MSELEKLTDLFKSTADEAAIDLMQWWHALLQEDSDVVKREYMLTMCSALSDNLAELCKLSREFEKLTEKEDEQQPLRQETGGFSPSLLPG